jgi:hypothetical protein
MKENEKIVPSQIDEKLDEKLKNVIKKQISLNIYKSWFENAVFGKNSVRVTNQYTKNTIARKYLSLLIKIYGGSAPELIVDPSLKKVNEKKRTKEKDITQNDNKVVYLPKCSEKKRIAPNVFLRSALFAAVKSSSEVMSEWYNIDAQTGYELLFKGERLTQADLDVWLYAAHLCKDSELGCVCRTTSYKFLKGIGRTTGKGEYVWLKNCIERLHAAQIKLRFKGGQWALYHLLEDVDGHDGTGELAITIPKKLITLFEAGDWAKIEIEDRIRIKRKPLALWLHAYFFSHRHPYRLKVETILKYSGSKSKNTRSFKQMLRKALNDIEFTGISGEIDCNLVSVKITSK